MSKSASPAKKKNSAFAAIDWQFVSGQMNHSGFVHVPKVISSDICEEYIGKYDEPIFRKTVVMERHRFGAGEYKYFDYPLPELIQTVREEFYPHLRSIASDWFEKLKMAVSFPVTFSDFQSMCSANNQSKPTPLILKYGKGGYNTLHQDLYGKVYFPIQLAFFLNEPGRDYTGGEFVLTEQVPRAQSKAIVLRPRIGDMIIFSTNFRPVEGVRGYYRANMRHGVSQVLSGERHTLGVIFHDAGGA